MWLIYSYRTGRAHLESTHEDYLHQKAAAEAMWAASEHRWNDRLALVGPHQQFLIWNYGDCRRRSAQAFAEWDARLAAASLARNIAKEKADA